MSDQGVTRVATAYDDVYLGFWTNWAQGPVLGLTLTLTRNGGGFFIAFLAIFVGATGKSFWRLVCLMLHRCLSSPDPQDGLFHQRQVVLRNSETPLQALWEFFWMGFAWRKKVRRPFLRTMWVLVTALVISLGWAAAGLFSSRVTTGTASEVLLKGSHCRMPGRLKEGVNPNEYMVEYSPWMTKLNTAYLAYAQQCYTKAKNVEDCRHFVKPNIPFNITRSGPCPFKSNMCKTGSITIDTGMMNSNMHLGLNMPKESQFELRIVNQCAPISSENHTSEVRQARFPQNPLKRYHLGNYTNSEGQSKDYLFQVPVNLSHSQFDGWDVPIVPAAGYQIGVTTVHGGISEKNTSIKSYEFIEELQRPDSDASLYFLSAPGIFYTPQVNDPWYSARTPSKGLTAPTTEGVQSYQQDEPASVLGCISQSQVCNPNASGGPRCQELGGWLQSLETFKEPWGESPSNKTSELLDWIREALGTAYIPLDMVVKITSDHALSARFRLNTFSQLPDNQWEEEVLRWTATSTASIQGLFVQLATGSKGLSDLATAPPDNAQAWKLCKNQRIVSTNFSSFNVIGILLIIVGGGIIIILDLTLEFCIDAAQRSNPRHSYGRLEWKSNATLQIHRMAHESIGSGLWTKTQNMIPVTLPGQLLTQLDISDQDHPRLKEPMHKTSTLSLYSSSTFKSSETKCPPIGVEVIERRETAELNPQPTSEQSSVYSEHMDQIPSVALQSQYTPPSPTIRSNRDYYHRFSMQKGREGQAEGQQKQKQRTPPRTPAQQRYYAQ